LFKRFLVLSLIFCILINFNISVNAYSAVSYCLYDPIAKKVIASSNMNSRMSMASTTKIMTALIVCEICNLDEEIEITDKMIAVEGSSIGLQVGDKISYECLLYGLMLESGNDAALSIAISVCGSQEAFAKLMNEKANKIGMKNTNFVTPNGLDDEFHYTTALDMAVLGGFAMNNETFRLVVGTKVYKAVYNNGETYRTYYNHNRLLSTLDGAEGIKTGFTKKSGRCLVSSCKRNGVRLIAVTLNDGNDWRDHKALYDYGFKQYEKVSLQRLSKTIDVAGGEKEQVTVESEVAEIYFYDGLYSFIKRKVYLPKFLYAPISKNEIVGKVEYIYNDSVIATADIFAVEDISAMPVKQKSELLEFFEVFKKLLVIK